MKDLPFNAKEVFDLYSGTASKKFGQNYIFSQNINQKIVNFAGNLHGKKILEIGPGPGGLTLEILKQNPKSLTIVEIDKQWSLAWLDLSKKLDLPMKIIQEDALKLDLCNLDCDILISNLPYNISSQILFKVLPNLHKFESLILMFQKELADRICSSIGTKSYGKLSIISQWKANIKKVLTLPPGAFCPAPSVYSSVLKFSPKKLDNVDFNKFNQLLTIAFANRRKQLFGQILPLFEKDTLVRIFSKLDIKESARAEEISLAQFLELLKFVK